MQANLTLIAIALAASFVAGCGDNTTRCADNEPGLVVDVSYLGGEAGPCVHISVVSNISIDLVSGALHLTRLDALSASRDEVVFGWPAGLQDGSDVTVAFDGNGEAQTVGLGEVTFKARTTECQVVSLPVTCAFSCSPQPQQGCSPGQKCTFVESALDPLAGRTDCVADGTVAEGGSCQFDGAGRDDCVGGLWCDGASADGRSCRAICNDPRAACASAQPCTALGPEFFKTEGTGYGVCRPGT